MLEPELVERPILELLRARQDFARVLVRMLGHDLLGTEEDVGCAPQHLFGAVVLILLGIAHPQGVEDPLASAHGELEGGEEALFAEGRLGARLHLDPDAQQAARALVVALLDVLARAVDRPSHPDHAACASRGGALDGFGRDRAAPDVAASPPVARAVRQKRLAHDALENVRKLRPYLGLLS